jgi:predicted nucleic acid-binding protein
MMVDASAIMAVIAKEPEREVVIQLTKGAKILSPNIVSYEIANGLTKMVKKKVVDKERMLKVYEFYQQPRRKRTGYVVLMWYCIRGLIPF